MSSTAVIGGTGLNQLAGLELIRAHSPETPFGEPSAPVQEGRLAGNSVFFLPRHGTRHHLPPHKINYRANLWALRELGVERVVAVNAVGGIHAALGPGALVVPDQIIDYTWGREQSLYDGSGAALDHIDFTRPYTAGLRAKLLQAAASCNIPCADGATYGATQGPRLETAAEVQRLLRDGCDLVGMTGMPEAALAVELGLAYAAICLVVNTAAGLSDEPITQQGMAVILEQKIATIGEILARFLQLPP
ncbi:MAG: S-methyl-5'-thioinosine phosphorylase [Gammaproteobacteria bacterium]|nr:S-methyl-5'-thioinosine phosphorylase [Gammaproteobacteria bacterium]